MKKHSIYHKRPFEKAAKGGYIMGDCGCNSCGCSNFDFDMILWVLIIIVIVTTMCNN